MDVGRGEQRDSAVAVLAVIPGEEPLAEGSGVFDQAELVCPAFCGVG